MFIQSIVLPKGASLEAVVAADAKYAWLHDVNTEKADDCGEYKRYTHMPVEKFVKESLNMVKLEGIGGWAIVGKFEEGQAAEVKKTMEVPLPAMYEVVASKQSSPIQYTFAELFDNEVWSFMDVVKGVMSQSGQASKTRKAAINGAIDAFKTFLNSALDALGETAVKLDTGLVIKGEVKKTELEVDDMFKTKEEFVSAVAEVIGQIEAQKNESAQAQAAKKAETDKQVAMETSVATLGETVTKLETTLTEISTKLETLGSQLTTTAGSQAGDEGGAAPQAVKKGESDGTIITDKAKKPDMSVFGGLLTVSKQVQQ